MTTKIAIVIRDDLAVWQKLNVTAFLATGLVAENPQLIGATYRDADGNQYSPLLIQPVIVLGADRALISKIHARALRREARCAVYIEEMLATSNDTDNRNAVAQFPPDELKIVGLALRNDRRIVDKITKGAKMHG